MDSRMALPPVTRAEDVGWGQLLPFLSKLPPLRAGEPRRYIAYPDAGVFMDVMPHRMCDKPSTYECKCAAGAGCGVVTMATQMQRMAVFTGGQPDESCADAHGTWGVWRCYLGQYAWPHLQQTFLLNQMQTDEWQVRTGEPAAFARLLLGDLSLPRASCAHVRLLTPCALDRCLVAGRRPCGTASRAGLTHRGQRSGSKRFGSGAT